MTGSFVNGIGRTEYHFMFDGFGSGNSVYRKPGEYSMLESIEEILLTYSNTKAIIVLKVYELTMRYRMEGEINKYEKR